MTSREKERRNPEALTIERILAGAPHLSLGRVENVSRVSSGGNPVFRVATERADLTVRFPGRRRFISPASEFDNQRRAFDAGLAPRPIVHDETSGAIVSAWLPGSAASRDAIDDTSALAAAMGESLARLHHTTSPFSDTVTPEQALAFNLDVLPTPDPRVEKLHGRARAALAKRKARGLANCHGDPTVGNWLVRDDARLALLDFEYSHRTTPAWDLAIACNALADAEDKAKVLVESYELECRRLGGEPVDDDKLLVMRGVAALTTAAWCACHEFTGEDIDRALETAETWLS